MNYDEFYRDNPSYFGNPFPELIAFFQAQQTKGKVLDVGCGQGRNAIPLLDMGFSVHAIDNSQVAINQLGKVAENQENLQAEHRDFFDVESLAAYDIILLDGFFHFNEHDRQIEEEVIRKIRAEVLQGTLIVTCFAEREESVLQFEKMVKGLTEVHRQSIRYSYRDKISEWEFETFYWLYVHRME